MQLKDLAPNARNPRTITDKKLELLKKTIKEFGSLDGVIFNQTTKRLVSGHQRQKAFSSSMVQITQRFDSPTQTGTVAEGFVTIEGERFPYREVQWSEAKEMAGNLAANKNAGDWNTQELNNWFQELGTLNFDIDLTMFDQLEVQRILDQFSPTAQDQLPPPVDPKGSEQEDTDTQVSRIILFFKPEEYEDLIVKAQELMSLKGCQDLSELFSALIQSAHQQL